MESGNTMSFYQYSMKKYQLYHNVKIKLEIDMCN